MEFHIYKYSADGRKLYVTNIPGDDNPLGGVGYQGMPDGSRPKAAGTAPTEESAIRVCKYLHGCFYGKPEEHFYESVEVRAEGKDHE